MARLSKFYPFPHAKSGQQLGPSENFDDQINFQFLGTVNVYLSPSWFITNDNIWVVTTSFGNSGSSSIPFGSGSTAEIEARAFHARMIDQADSAGP